MEWQKYEKEVLEECCRVFRNSDISYNVHIKGVYSERMRQIDVFIKTRDGKVYVIDAKMYAKKVDIKSVESFVGMIKDVGANYGIIVSEKGFTKAAINRAHLGEDNIEVDILSLNELKMFQAEGAISYSGRYGVAINAPFGWIIDGKRRNGLIASLYQRGLTFEEATINMEWAYLNFWDKNDTIDTIDKLIAFQNDNLLGMDNEGKIDVKVNDIIKERIFASKKYPTKEITLYRDFHKFILFIVLFSPDNTLNRNINKMRYLLLNALPLEVEHEKLLQRKID
ncbi:MAG: restriction endonuclease [Prevotella sp.]|nr:restriction endonuclease [Prevotella sp.]